MIWTAFAIVAWLIIISCILYVYTSSDKMNVWQMKEMTELVEILRVTVVTCLILFIFMFIITQSGTGG
jgi:hypothetical protein